MNDPLAELAERENCICWACITLLSKEWNFYVLCPECGCKRCPKATNHLHDCTRSNDSGQYGSDYGVQCTLPCCHEYGEAKVRLRAEFDALDLI